MSTPSNSSRVEALFHEALEHSDPAARARHLSAACGGDESLEAAVKCLLDAHQEIDHGFLAATPGERAAQAAEAAAALDPTLAAQFAALKPEETGDRIGHYKLLQELGRGGFGTVWLAEQAEPVRRRVALKIIKLGMDTEEVVARFEQERQALAVMNHPNIAKVFDAGVTPTGRPFFVMELVRGTPITAYCDTNNVSMSERLRLFVQVCSAVQHAHQKGIIHRDLKPSNVLVTMQDELPVPKVIDFGVAKATQAKLTDLSIFTHFQCMVGTPLYMSPEQAEMSSIDIDTRSDIYSLGVLLYELLTGKTPFDPEELMRQGLDEVRRVIRERDPPKPSTALSSIAQETLTAIAKHRRTPGPTLISTLKRDLDWIVLRAMEKDRTRRYETADSLARDIERHLNDEPVLARPPSQIYRFRRMVRRNKLAFASAAALAAALITGATVSTWQAVRAKKAESIAGARLKEVAAERDAREAALLQARAAEADTQAFGDFLVNRVLATARPQDVDGGLGIDVTVARALEDAEKQLAQDFAGRPRAEARARDAIGVTWESLGRYQEAKAQLERAVELGKRELGPNHQATLTSINNLAVVLQKSGDLSNARLLDEQAYQQRRKQLGPDHPKTLTSLHNLAAVYYDAGELEKAQLLYEQVFEKSKAVLGLDHPNTLRSMNSLARVYKDSGDLQKALPLYQTALEKSRSRLGPDHPYTLTSMNNLAVTYERTGDPEKAVPLYEQSLTKSQEKLGPNHPDTLTTMSNLAGAYEKTGELAKAVSLYEEALERSRAALGQDHPATVECLINLAVAYEKARDFRKAIPLYEKALEERTARLGADHPDSLRNLANLAVAYTEAGDLQRALEMYQAAFQKRKARLGAEHADTLKSLHNLALAYRDVSQSDKALTLLEDLLTVQKKQLGSNHPSVADTEKEISAVRAGDPQHVHVENLAQRREPDRP